jgi:ribulose kinase
MNGIHNNGSAYLAGLDVGSTTVKAVVVDVRTDQIVWRDYQRHETRQPEKLLEFLRNEKRKLSFLFRDLPARHPELDYPVTIGDYVRMMSKHGPNHLEQIERLKQEAAGK